MCLGPLAGLIYGTLAETSPNPIEIITRYTGDWTLRIIVMTLTVTPLRRLLDAYGIIRVRRMFGLFAFFYGPALPHVHVARQVLRVDEMFKDVTKRPFITAGFTAFVLMVPLALTSTRGRIRRSAAGGGSSCTGSFMWRQLPESCIIGGS